MVDIEDRLEGGRKEVEGSGEYVEPAAPEQYSVRGSSDVPCAVAYSAAGEVESGSSPSPG